MSEQPRYVGRIHGRLGYPGLELAETSYRGGQRIGRHVHDHPLVVLIVSGEMTEHVGGRSVRCRPGTALYHPPGEAHAHRFGTPGARCLVLQLDPVRLERLQLGPDTLPDGPVARRDQTVTGTGRLLHDEFRRGGAAVAGAVEGLALALLSALARPHRASRDDRPAWLAAVLDRLNDDPAADVGLADLAEVADVSPEHLARTFRGHQGCTIGEYVRRLRVEKARHALTATGLPLSRIALELGFYDQSHFTRTFKAHVGCTPGHYRRTGGAGGG